MFQERIIEYYPITTVKGNEIGNPDSVDGHSRPPSDHCVVVDLDTPRTPDSVGRRRAVSVDGFGPGIGLDAVVSEDISGPIAGGDGVAASGEKAILNIYRVFCPEFERPLPAQIVVSPDIDTIAVPGNIAIDESAMINDAPGVPPDG